MDRGNERSYDRTVRNVLAILLLAACSSDSGHGPDAMPGTPATCDGFVDLGPGCCTVRLPVVEVAFPHGSRPSPLGDRFALIDHVYRHPAGEVGTNYTATDGDTEIKCAWMACIDRCE